MSLAGVFACRSTVQGTGGLAFSSESERVEEEALLAGRERVGEASFAGGPGLERC